MNVRDFALLSAVCFVWGLNIVVTKWAVTDAGVPPLFFAAVRFLGIAIVLVTFLRPRPQDLRALFLIAMCIGAAHFALLFVGLANAEASAAAVTGQLGVPFSTLMSMVFLGEQVRWRRGLGIVLAFLGVLIIAVDPTSFSISYGLLYIVASAFIGSIGGILMKRMEPISALQMQAWVGAFSFLPLFALSGILEADQASSYVQGGVLVWFATAFAVLGVSIFGHGAFYTLIKRHDISLLSPLTLMTPIWGVVLSVLMLGEPLTLRLVIGAVVSLSGVFVIAVRRNQRLPEASLGKKLGGVS
ncbi:MAG: DMT family transporter [Pseudomonadota bacterium]